MKIIAVILLSCFLTSVRFGYNINATNLEIKSNFEKIDTSRIAILQFAKENTFHFNKSDRPANLSQDDITQIETLIGNAVIENNKKGGKYFHIENSSKYYKQLVAIINPKGEKEVWVNCFCTLPQGFDWKKNAVLMLDGGSCYFNLKINLTKNITFDFYVNNYE